MHKFLWIAVGIVTLAGCKQSEKGNFTVEATIQNAPLQKVYLEELSLNDVKVVDTAKIEDASGKFSFHGIAPEESLYRIRFEEGNKLIIFPLKGGTLKIKGDYNALDKLGFEGSDAATELNQFLAQISLRGQALRSAAMSFDSLRNANTPDSLLQLTQEALTQQQQQFISFIENFANHTKSPANAVFAVNMLPTKEDLVAAKEVFDNMEKRFPESHLVKTMMEEYKKLTSEESNHAAVGLGQTAPEIKLPDPNGKEIALSSLRGKYVLVDFWASWCAPCRAENPNVVKAYQQYKDKNFTIFSVSLDQKKEVWVKAIKDDGLTWNHVSDLKFWDSEPAKAYGVEAIPANFLLDPAGKIIAMNLRGEDLENKLKEVLK